MPVQPVVKLASPPSLHAPAPRCSVCSIATVLDGDELRICPSCGTAWDARDRDEAPGMLYEEWSGEKLDLPVTAPGEVLHVRLAANRAGALSAVRRGARDASV